MKMPSWWPVSPKATDSQVGHRETAAGNMPDSGNLTSHSQAQASEEKLECHIGAPENVTLTNCAEVIRDYFGAAAAVDSDDWRGYGEESHPAPVETSRPMPCGYRLGENGLCGYWEPPSCDDGPEREDIYAFGASDATVPLAEQIAQYGDRCEAVLDALHTNLEDEWFRTAVIRLGVERLTEGHETFGSKMYSWDANKLDDEMLEEIADYVVYGTSGSFFNLRSAR